MIKKGEQAKYSGVLMPVEILRDFQTDHDNVELYKTEIEMHENDLANVSSPSSSTLVLIGAGGLVMGFLVGFLAR